MKKYVTPELEVFALAVEDAVRTSISTDPDKGDLENWDYVIGN